MENQDKPTKLTPEDIDKLIEHLMNSGIKIHSCIKCSKEYIGSYGHSISECDECYFSRFTKEEREAFYRSFF